MIIDRARLYEPYSLSIDYVVGRYGRRINARTCEALAACNGDRFPESFCDWRNVFDRMGIRAVVVRSGVVPEPLVKYDDSDDDGRISDRRGVLIVPNYANPLRLFHGLLHEAAETAMKRPDLAPELRYPPDWGDHHTMACVVEWCHEREIVLNGSVWDMDMCWDGQEWIC